jgi:hypothetical protein
MFIHDPRTIKPDDPKKPGIPRPRLEREGNPFKLEIKREGGRLVVRRPGK